uniref:Uncharacterized protein n=1 Tax=viral metagenome TaxID=1070528 RepID=A0A6C0DPI1_9ZZZZ
MSSQIIPLSAYICVGLTSIVLSYALISESAEEKTESTFTSMLPSITSAAAPASATAVEASAPPQEGILSSIKESIVGEKPANPIYGGRKTKKRNKNKKSSKSGKKKNHSKHR